MSLTRSQIALTVALAAATAGGVGYAMHRSSASLAPVTHITTLDADRRLLSVRSLPPGQTLPKLRSMHSAHC